MIGLAKRLFVPRGIDTYYMFKNQKRRAQFRSINRFLNFFSVLATIAFVIAMVAFGLVIGTWLFLFIITFGLVNIFANGGDFMNLVMLMGLIGLIAFGVIFILKFVLQWGYIMAESRDLNKNPENNQTHIKVARAIRKIKIGNLITLLIFIVLAVLIYLVYQESGVSSDNNTNLILLGAAALIAIIGNKIFAGRQYKSVEPEVKEIRKQWRQKSIDKKAETQAMIDAERGVK